MLHGMRSIPILKLNTDYNQKVACYLNMLVCFSSFTEAITPGNVKVSHVSSSTVSLTWEPPAGEVGGYVVTCFFDSKTHQKKITVLDSVRFSDLKPGLKYDFQIKTQLKSGGLSQPALISAHTGELFL